MKKCKSDNLMSWVDNAVEMISSTSNDFTINYFAKNPMLFGRAKYVWLEIRPYKTRSGYSNLELILNLEDESGDWTENIPLPFYFLRMIASNKITNYEMKIFENLWSCDISKELKGERIPLENPSYVDFGLLKDVSPLLEKQYQKIVFLILSNFELYTASNDYSNNIRLNLFNNLMNFLFPPKCGDVEIDDFIRERHYVNFNRLLMDKNQRNILGYDLDNKNYEDPTGAVVSFYCKYYTELVNSIKNDNGNIKKEKINLILNFLEFAIETGINENYFTTNIIQNIFELINKLKEAFTDAESPIISISKSKYPETYSFLNTMIKSIDFDSFKNNDDFKSYYDRNGLILKNETLEAPKLVTKEELLKYLCLEE